MPHFTFIMFFNGADYISQHEAKDLLSACVLWKNHIVQDKPFKTDLDVEEFAKSFDFYIQTLPPIRKKALPTFGILVSMRCGKNP